MNYLWTKALCFIEQIGFWLLSLVCETPFTFSAGVLAFGFKDYSTIDSVVGMTFIVWYFSLFCRLISLHLIGSWILKHFLVKHGASPLLFGLADFALANIWVGVWAWFFPDGLASFLFHDIDSGTFTLTSFWVISIPPIGLGSMLYRYALQTRLFSGRRVKKPLFQ